MVWCLLLLSLFAKVFSLSPEQLQSNLNAAINNSRINSYVIPTGDYYFKETYFFITNATNFEIISSKLTTFYFNFSYGVAIKNCNNVSISNIIIDFKPICFSQGIINDINKTEKSIIVTIDEYYPRPDKLIHKIFAATVVKVIYFDPNTREMIHNQTGVNNWNYSLSLNNEKPYKYKIYLLQMKYVPSVGDLVTMGPRTGNTLTCINCSNMVFTNLTLYGSCNMAVFESYGIGGNIYNNYQLIRSPQNNGNNLLTSNADSFHSFSNLHGPTLQNSYLSFPGDDFVNVHNRINIILQRINDYSIYAIDTQNGITFNNVNINDSLLFYELNTLIYIDMGLIVDITNIKNNETLNNEAKESYFIMEQAPYNCVWHTNWSDTTSVFEISFKEKLNINVTTYMLIEYDLNNGAIIENNHFHSGFDTFMKLKSKDSVVKNNLLEYAHGVHIATEQTWLEGELGLNNITIENNQFVGAGNKNQAIIIQNQVYNITVQNNTFN